jgi:hypothetical protein
MLKNPFVPPPSDLSPACVMQKKIAEAKADDKEKAEIRAASSHNYCNHEHHQRFAEDAFEPRVPPADHQTG